MPEAMPGQTRDLLLKFDSIRDELLVLCESIEAFADTLGGTPDWRVGALLAEQMQHLVQQSRLFDDTQLFPFLIRVAETNSALLRSVGHLKVEYIEDYDVAHEVTEMLNEFSGGTPRLSQDAIGYLLRGYFVSMRRHLAFKTDVLARALDLNSP